MTSSRFSVDDLLTLRQSSHEDTSKDDAMRQAALRSDYGRAPSPHATPWEVRQDSQNRADLAALQQQQRISFTRGLQLAGFLIALGTVLVLVAIMFAMRGA